MSDGAKTTADGRRLMPSARWIALLGLLLGSLGCGPFVTLIPTYWPPQIARYPSLSELPDPTVRAQRPRPPSTPQIVVPEDTREECLSIYTITSRRQLFAYTPMDNSFTLKGTLQCPGTWSSPFSMAVSSTGVAHVLYNNGELFEVDVHTAECKATAYTPNQSGFRLFGMAYGPAVKGKGEDLYVVEISFVKPSRGLARIDTDTFELEFIGPLSKNPGNAIELTPTGRGPLSGYFINNGIGGTLVDINTGSGHIDKSKGLKVGTGSSSLAVSWWGDAYYIFTQHWRGTVVSRYNPATDEVQEVSTLPQSVVGAGVSTCAPSVRNRKRSPRSAPRRDFGPSENAPDRG